MFIADHFRLLSLGAKDFEVLHCKSQVVWYLQSLLRHHDLVYIQPGMVALWFHESDTIFLTHYERGAVVFETHHFLLLVSNSQWSKHCILRPIKDIKCDKLVHLFLLKLTWCAATAPYWQHGPHRSTELSLELRLSVNSIRYKLIQTCLALKLYLIIAPFSAIGVFSLNNW